MKPFTTHQPRKIRKSFRMTDSECCFGLDVHQNKVLLIGDYWYSTVTEYKSVSDDYSDLLRIDIRLLFPNIVFNTPKSTTHGTSFYHCQKKCFFIYYSENLDEPDGERRHWDFTKLSESFPFMSKSLARVRAGGEGRHRIAIKISPEDYFARRNPNEV